MLNLFLFVFYFKIKQKGVVILKNLFKKGIKIFLVSSLCIAPKAIFAQELIYVQPSYEGMSIREKPSLNAFIERRTAQNELLVVSDYNEKWYKLENGEGYVEKDNVILLDERFQDEMPSETNILEEDTYMLLLEGNLIQVPKGTTYTPIVSLNEGLEVIIGDKRGYIFLEENLLKGLLDQSVSNESPLTDVQELLDFALLHLGNPYVYGGNDLHTGVDCSSFVQLVFKEFGYGLQRTTQLQLEKDGYFVTEEALSKGDLIFYGYDNQVSHVALYLGEGKIIHAATEETGICIDNYQINKPIIAIKRIIK